MTQIDNTVLDEKSFDELFKKYYSMLCIVAYDYVGDKSLAEEMVQDTFLNIWEKRNTIQVTPVIKYYLVKATQNTCLQYLRKKTIETQRMDAIEADKMIAWRDDYPLGRLFEKEIAEIIEHTIQSFPPQIKKVFRLSRYREMTYPQIADLLNVSENTVKTQVKIALSRLRSALKDYL
jgi:RNA polymerase sigma-70 factor (ECF subfamily)